MSTLPGLASKGEKSKQKFQSLDINNLYRVSRGENLEKQQQKSQFTYKHGMQSLGKVPNARRAPANLPSLKSEHSGSDASVPLVPPGGPGWGKQEATTTSPSTSTTSTVTTPTTSSVPSVTNQQPTPPQLSTHQANIALPVTTTIPPPTKHGSSGVGGGGSSSVAPAITDKSWSAVMSGPDPSHPPLYQSPQFQHEFPSLSVGDGGVPVRIGSEVQYTPGLSLRPQTEGSWIQGGSRSNVDGPPRSNSVPLGPPPQLPAQAGLQQQQLPPQFRAVMPTFMYKGNFAPSGTGTPNQNPSAVNGRNRPETNRPSPRTVDTEELTPRPIIKEEELSRMDEIDKDMGWTCQDDIDYNQKLAFSDEESAEKSGKRDIRISSANLLQINDTEKLDFHQTTDSQRTWGNNNNNNNLNSLSRHRTSDEELLKQRRTQHNKDLELTVQRAKQRKEEEEKRFNEATRQGAAKKLMELEEKMSKRNRDEEGVGTINPSVVPAKPIVPAEIPLPDFQREKDRETRSRTPNDSEEKSVVVVADGTTIQQNRESSFRQMTQIEGKNFAPRKHVKGGNERDRESRENGPSFSRQFQNQLPPRFQKNRNNTVSNISSHMNFAQPSVHMRWTGSQNLKTTRQESPEMDLIDERKDYKRQSSEDSHKSTTQRSPSDLSHKSFGDDLQDFRHSDYDHRRYNKEDEKWIRDKEKNDEWHDKKDKDRHDGRPQRPDSRDSRASRDSRQSRDSARDSEPRDHIGSWAETAYEPTYEEKRREDRRQVPGPITKERIEADDLRNEKQRGLTQLKRGQIPDKKVEVKEEKIEEESKGINNNEKKPTQDGGSSSEFQSKAWADTAAATSILLSAGTEKVNNNKSELKQDIDGKKSDKSDSDYKDDKRKQQAPRNYAANKGGWNSNEYHRSGWPKRTGRGGAALRSGGGPQRDYHGTDSDASLEENHMNKDDKKFQKDEKNKEIKNEKSINNVDRSSKGDKFEAGGKRDPYVPRGEPSRHGRGGGANFRGRGGLSKRIDGYGPPPSKSPFGHTDEKDHLKDKKLLSGDENCDHGNVDDRLRQQNQPVFSSGMIGITRKETNQKIDDKTKRKPDSRRGKSKTSSNEPGKRDEENIDSNSDNSDDKSLRKSQNKSTNVGSAATRGGPLNQPPNRRSNPPPPPRLSADKKPFRENNPVIRQNSNGTLLRCSITVKADEKLSSDQSNNSGENTQKNKVESVGGGSEDVEEKVSAHGGDSDGFQEVKSKKTGKERQKSVIDEKQHQQLSSTTKLGNWSTTKESIKTKSKHSPVASQQLTQQQIQNIPPLMATPVNPPPVLQQSSKNQFDRPRLSRLAPRFAKQRENNRLQKVQLQQQNICDVNDINKVNQNMNMYGVKDPSMGGVVVSSSSSLNNAWDKSLGPQLRAISSDVDVLTSVVGGGDSSSAKVVLEHVTNNPSSSPNNDKIIGKSSTLSEKAILDGSTPPVNTIIFENTNFKSAPGSRNSRSEKPRAKLEDGIENSSVVVSGFNKPINDLLCKNDKQSESAIQIPLPFKEDNADIKLDFFDSDLSHLTDDKSSKNLCLPRSMHTAMTTVNNTISTADALNFKIQSVKKMWETPADHVVGQDDGNSSFPSSFVSDPSTLDPNSFVKANDNADDNHEGYSPSPNQVVSNSTTNVCKVKPTQQVSGGGSGGVAVLNSGSHQHSGIMGPSLMGNPLSPPPLQPVIGTGVNLGQPPQQYTTNQHIGYQAGLGGSNQYGIPAIPSPPNVMYNSTQQIQQTGLYGPFQLDQGGVLGGQGRSQYSQYPNHFGLGQTASSPYSTQSVYLQTQPHPPPTAQAPPDLYQNISNYRLSATGPFGQNQQLNNPTTVLISSTSNSLMSASVKPSSQPISAIGTKAGGVGQAYQQQSQQTQPVYMTYETAALQANYLPSAAGVMQRGPTGPVQNNVVSALQSSSYYSGSTGQTAGYFQQPGSSTIQSAQLQQHQAGYGLQGNVFGTHSQSHTNAGLQSFNSHFLSAPMQLAAAAMNAQQFRSGLPTQYIKGVGGQQLSDQSSRSQQLKSPGSQEVLSSVFNSGFVGSQISSPKLRQNCKQPPPQPSPTAQHKYNMYQGVGNQQSGNMQRYPNPIQRPVNFQQNLGSMQQNSASNQKHRPNNSGNNKSGNRQYYQNNSISSQNDKVDDGSKLNDGRQVDGSVANKTVIGTSSTPVVVNASEIAKEAINIEETTALKD